MDVKHHESKVTASPRTWSCVHVDMNLGSHPHWAGGTGQQRGTDIWQTARWGVGGGGGSQSATEVLVQLTVWVFSVTGSVPTAVSRLT